MKRTFGKILLILSIVVLATVLFAACAKKNGGSSNDAESLTVTINWNLADAQNSTIVVGSDGKVNLSSLTVPSNPGYKLAGFYTDAACTNAFDAANYTVTFNFTIYAKWEQNTEARYTIVFYK